MNCSANSPGIQLSFFSESLNTIVCSANDRARSQAAEGMDQTIRDRGWKKAEDYKYSDGKTKVSLICPEGHHVKIAPSQFKSGNGCAKCSGVCTKKARDDFEQAICDRGWSKGEDYKYVNGATKTSLICPDGHPVRISPSKFKYGRGCAKCSGSCPVQARLRFERLIQERGYQKGEDYAYFKMSRKVSLICPDGHSYQARPADFRSGYGCMQCSKICPEKAKKSLDQLIKKRGYQKAEDYIYVNARANVSLICSKGHRFKAAPTNLKSGQGCPGCASYGFTSCLPATLYYIAFCPQPTRIVYKIGITNRTVAERYHQFKMPYRILMEKHFESGVDCLNEETRLLRKYRSHRCKDTPVDGLGNKELFDIDILGLDVEL